VESRKKEFPHVFILLLVIITVMTILTYIIPAGQYDRVLDSATGRQVVDPFSFKYIERTPVSFFGMLLSIVEGLIQAANISVLIFCAFATLYLIEQTGTIDAGIAWMVNRTKKNPKYATATIVVVMFVLSAWASTGTLSFEEIIAFIPIFTTLAIALGYDPLVGLGMSYVPVGMGFASATLNPFTIGVAQGIAELPLFSGIGLRIAVFLSMSVVTIGYVLLYAKKIRKDPSKSIVADIIFEEFGLDKEKSGSPFTLERKLTLIVLFIGISIMVYGLSKLHWYINEISAVFLGITIFTGIVNRWHPNKVANTFVKGLSNGVLSALVVGFARGILVVITKGNILDTIIYSASIVLNKMGLYASAVGMLIFQTILNFFIPSGSGQAATVMPIMVPLADLIGMNRQISVLIFQFGDGYSNLIWPTSFVLIACAAARVPLNKYYRWFLPLFCISLVLQVIFIFIALNIGYGPF